MNEVQGVRTARCLISPVSLLQRCAAAVWRSCKGFLQDLTDKSAEKVSPPNWAGDALTTTGLAIVGASGQAEAVQKLVSLFAGDFASVVQLLLLLLALLWCGAIISGKAHFKQQAGVVAASDAAKTRSYAFSQPLRVVAKIGLLLLLIAVPLKLSAVADNLIPLPDTIYGHVFYDTGKPVDGAPLRAVTSAGSDITSGSWTTDSNGFYVIKAKKRFRRSDVLRVIPDGCTVEVSLALTKANEVTPQSDRGDHGLGLRPMFEHRVHCGGRE